MNPPRLTRWRADRSSFAPDNGIMIQAAAAASSLRRIGAAAEPQRSARPDDRPTRGRPRDVQEWPDAARSCSTLGESLSDASCLLRTFIVRQLGTRKRPQKQAKAIRATAVRKTPAAQVRILIQGVPVQDAGPSRWTQIRHGLPSSTCRSSRPHAREARGVGASVIETGSRGRSHD